MAAPPKFKRFPMEQLEGESEGVQALAAALTELGTDTVGALTRALTRGENMRGQESEVTFETGAALTVDDKPFPLRIRPSYGGKPGHVWVTDVKNLTDTSAAGVPTSATQPMWQHTPDGQVEIRYVTGLATSTRYRIRVLME